MPRYVIERRIPDAGNMTEDELRAAARDSIAAMKELGPRIQWLHSYVTDDKVYCVYIAPDEDTVRRHAHEAGLPADRISAVRGMLDPANYC